MMKKFLTTLVLFALFFFLVDKLFYWKIQALPEREFDKRLQWILDGKMNKDILIFGSSRAHHNLYADLIQDSLKRSTYNLGYRGSNINFQLFLLKTVLKHNKKPKLILLTVDDDREFVPEKTLQFRYDKLYPLVQYQEITHELIDQKEFSPFAIGLYSARIGWKQFSQPKARTKYDTLTAAGSSILNFTAADFDKKMQPSKRYNAKLELPERLNAFKSFQELCRKQAIPLVILVPPNCAVQNKKFVNRIKVLLLDRTTMFYGTNPSLFQNSNLFSDRSHLNKLGAIAYTNYVLKQLKAHAVINSIEP